MTKAEKNSMIKNLKIRAKIVSGLRSQASLEAAKALATIALALCELDKVVPEDDIDKTKAV